MAYNICKFCKKRYSNDIVGEYCSDTCKTQYELLPDKFCIGCGVTLEKTATRKFCKSSCHNNYQREINMVEHKCVQCNTLFKIQKSSRRKKTCSKDCERQWQKSNERNEKRMDTLKKNNRKLYGVEHTFQRFDVAATVKQVKLDKYGNPGYCNPAKTKKTKLQRYGDSGYANSDKAKQTKLQRYGKLDFNEKSNVTKLEKYGTLDFSEKARKTTLQKYGTLDFSKKARETILQKYGSAEKYTKYLLQKSYERLVKKYLHVTFLFNSEEYIGAYNYKLYPFECNTCATKFDDYVTNGLPPECPICNPRYSNNTSSIEVDIVDWLRSEFSTLTFETSNRKIIKPLELDIYCPERKIAIEVNGVYWHSETNGGKSKYYHLEKTNLAKSTGTQLTHILDIEWLTKQEIVKSILRNKFGVSKKLYARNCNIQLVDTSNTRKFFEQNHIQGYSNASISIGLFIDHTLVSCMSFTKNRFSHDTSWEISRFANSLNTTVVGGAAKLFKYFIQNYSPKKIISYSDLRWFSGNVYESIGMHREQNTPPSYTYIGHKNTLHNRLAFQKHKLAKKLTIYDSSLTEWENMKNNGYDRIWDCGHSKFVYTFSQSS